MKGNENYSYIWYNSVIISLATLVIRNVAEINDFSCPNTLGMENDERPWGILPTLDACSHSQFHLSSHIYHHWLKNNQIKQHILLLRLGVIVTVLGVRKTVVIVFLVFKSQNVILSHFQFSKKYYHIMWKA